VTHYIVRQRCGQRCGDVHAWVIASGFSASGVKFDAQATLIASRHTNPRQKARAITDTVTDR
jgi:hypothetical protein